MTNTASTIRCTLTFKTAQDAPANVTQAANIARSLKIKIGRGIGAGKYDCKLTDTMIESLDSDTVLRCAYGSVAF